MIANRFQVRMGVLGDTVGQSVGQAAGGAGVIMKVGSKKTDE